MDLETLATVGLPLKWVGDRLMTCGREACHRTGVHRHCRPK